MVHAAGQMDEQFFAVPGLTVLREGVPRIPYCSTRERGSFFENADLCLFALPPALHYVQAPFFAWLEPGYATARMPLFIGGFLILWLTLRLAKTIGVSTGSIGLAICMLAVSRPLMFTGTTARPDLLCAACGLATVWCMHVWNRTDRTLALSLSGALAGMGGLFHPVAIVFGIQGFCLAVLKLGTIRQRLARGFVFAATSVATLSLWLPLIALYPHEFFSQFGSNVLERRGPGMLQLFFGLGILWYHMRNSNGSSMNRCSLFFSSGFYA